MFYKNKVFTRVHGAPNIFNNFYFKKKLFKQKTERQKEMRSQILPNKFLCVKNFGMLEANK